MSSRRGSPRRRRRGSATSTSSCSAPAPPGWRRRSPSGRCAACSIVTKDTLDAGSTAWAQGGLAGVLDPDRLAREPRPRHARRRRRTVRRGGRARARRRGAEGDPLPDAARRGVRPGRPRRRRAGPHPRGRPQPQPHRPLRRRSQRRRGAAHARPVGGRRRRRGARSGVRARPRRRHGRRRERARRPASAIALLDADGVGRVGRRRHGRAPSCSPPAVSARCSRRRRTRRP